MTILRLSLLCSFLTLIVCAPSSANSDTNNLPSRVVIIALDGVRRMEAFYPKKDRDPFPVLRSRIQNGDLISFGDPRQNQLMRLSNSYALSLPGYQSILSGKDSGTLCKGNSVEDCPLQPNETLLDLMLKNGTQDPTETLALASWRGVDRSVSQNPTAGFFYNSSFMKTGSPDPEQDVLERAYFTDLDRRIDQDRPQWGGSRKDQYTRELFEKLDSRLKSRLSFIQLVDPDEWAHKNDFWEYYRSIRENDQWIDAMMSESDRLEKQGRIGPTHYIITTDHGRGEGATLRDVFRSHGTSQPSSYRIWAFVRVSPMLRASIRKSSRSNYSHIDIRPTAEFLLGLKPSCDSSTCLVY